MNPCIISGIKIRAVSVALPDNTEDNKDLGNLFGDREIKRISDTIGIRSRRIAQEGTTALDMMENAVNHLFSLTGSNMEDIGFLVCITQTPDYIIPGNSFVLCNRMGASNHIFTLDVNAGCAGFTHGLAILGKLLLNSDAKLGLLVVGDTLSRFVNPRDKTERPLFGDAAAACLVECDRENRGMAVFWRTISKNYDKIIVPAGGMRNPSSEWTKQVNTIEEYIERSENDLIIKGSEVFSFSIKEVPELVNEALQGCHLDIDKVNLFFFHQANRFMVDYIRKKLKIPEEKVPIFLNDIGNTSSASIPVALCCYAESKGLGKLSGKYCMTGFGVGLSLSTVIADFENVIVGQYREGR